MPGLGQSLGGGNGNPFQYSCLGNPTDRGAWGLQSMGSQSWLWLSDSTHVLMHRQTGTWRIVKHTLCIQELLRFTDSGHEMQIDGCRYQYRFRYIMIFICERSKIIVLSSPIIPFSGSARELGRKHFLSISNFSWRN